MKRALVDVIEDGGEIDQETRLFDPKRGNSLHAFEKKLMIIAIFPTPTCCR